MEQMLEKTSIFPCGLEKNDFHYSRSICGRLRCSMSELIRILKEEGSWAGSACLEPQMQLRQEPGQPVYPSCLVSVAFWGFSSWALPFSNAISRHPLPTSPVILAQGVFSLCASVSATVQMWPVPKELRGRTLSSAGLRLARHMQQHQVFPWQFHTFTVNGWFICLLWQQTWITKETICQKSWSTKSGQEKWWMNMCIMGSIL